MLYHCIVLRYVEVGILLNAIRQLDDSTVKHTKDLEDGINCTDLGPGEASGCVNISETLSKLSILDLVTVLRRTEMNEFVPQHKVSWPCYNIAPYF